MNRLIILIVILAAIPSFSYTGNIPASKLRWANKLYSISINPITKPFAWRYRNAAFDAHNAYFWLLIKYGLNEIAYLDAQNAWN